MDGKEFALYHVKRSYYSHRIGKTSNRSYGDLNEGEQIFIGNKEVEVCP